MKAELQQQWKLLDLQKLDTRLDQIAYRLQHMPQNADIEAAKTTADRAAEESVLAQTAVMDVEREIKRAEGDIEQVDARMKRNLSRLESGAGSAKDMQALQHEVQTLERRKAVLEDAQIEVMERAESLRTRQEKVDAVLSEAEGKLKALQQELKAAAAELEDERVAVQHKRNDMASGFPADLLAEYERIRATSGIAAAALHGRRCLGCGMELDQRALTRIHNVPNNELVYCDDCGRILVRKPDVQA